MFPHKYINKQNSSGNVPNQEDLILIFLRTDFFDYISSQIPPNSSKQIKYNVKFDKKVSSEIAEEICDKIINTGYKKYKPLYQILIELIVNTHNHADIEEEKYHWCFQAYQNQNNNVFKCTFIDVGVGIFESKPIQEYKSKQLLLFHESNGNFFQKILKCIIISNDVFANY